MQGEWCDASAINYHPAVNVLIRPTSHSVCASHAQSSVHTCHRTQLEDDAPKHRRANPTAPARVTTRIFLRNSPTAARRRAGYREAHPSLQHRRNVTHSEMKTGTFVIAKAVSLGPRLPPLNNDDKKLGVKRIMTSWRLPTRRYFSSLWGQVTDHAAGLAAQSHL